MRDCLYWVSLWEISMGNYLFMCMHVYLYGLTGAVASGDQKRAWDPLELELHVFLSCPAWVLGTAFRSFARADAFLTTESSFQPCGS